MSFGAVLGALGGGGLFGGSSTTTVNSSNTNSFGAAVSPSISVSLGGGINAAPSTGITSQPRTSQSAVPQPPSGFPQANVGADGFLPAPSFQDPFLFGGDQSLMPILLIGGAILLLSRGK